VVVGLIDLLIFSGNRIRAIIFQKYQCFIEGRAPLERVYINQLNPPPAVCRTCGFDETKPQYPNALPCRTLLNKQYWIGRVLGKPGGFGIAYLAWDMSFDTPVAIKEYFPASFAGRELSGQAVHPHYGENGEIFAHGLQAFLNEAKTLARFDHPHILKVRSIFEENGTAYLVMDYLEGETLDAYLERQPDKRVGQARALEILLPVMDGLEQVHAQGFIHRDIKPLNIFLTRFTHNGEERPILLDFGAARLALGAHSQTMSIVLTPDLRCARAISYAGARCVDRRVRLGGDFVSHVRGQSAATCLITCS
jgi:hypothetical protein